MRGADIVTTVTADKTNATIITADMLAPGIHVNGVGGDCPGKTELHADVLAAAKVFVEYEPQSRIEGDLQQMPADFAVTELWRVLRGEAQRTHERQTTSPCSIRSASRSRTSRHCACSPTAHASLHSARRLA